MNERHIIDQLNAYLDNELSEKEKAIVEEHLSRCSGCAQELARLKALSETLKSWNAPEPSAHFDQAVRDKILSRELETRRVAMKMPSRRILIPSGLLAGLVLLVFINSYLARGLQGRMPIGVLREATDEIGEQFAPGYSGQDDTREFAKHSRTEAQKASGYQYEPYYYQASLEAPQAGGVSENVQTYSGVARDRTVAVDDTKVDASHVIKDKPAILAFMVTGAEAKGAVRSSVVSGKRAANAMTASKTIVQGSPAEGPVIVIQPVLPATGEGEKIIRTAQVQLEVEDGKEAYKKLNEICAAAGGYLASSNLVRDNDGRTSGHITMRIPQARFTEVLDTLRDFGKVKNIATDSADVSQEYKNVRARLDAAMVVYTKMLEALQQRKNTIDQAAHLESELTPVLAKIEALKNQLESLDNQVSFTTITVYFFEPRVSLKVLEHTKQSIRESAITASINFVKFLARILPATVAWAVVILVLVIGGLLVKGWIIRIFKK